MNKRIVVLGSILIVAIAGLWALSKYQKKEPTIPKTVQTQSPEKNTTDQPVVTKQQTPIVLSSFPQGFPVEDSAQLSDSYSYVPALSSSQQSTLSYTSQKTLAENQKIFSSYFTSAGFKIINKIEKDPTLFYYGSKDGNDLSVTVIKDKAGKVVVTASYLKRN